MNIRSTQNAQSASSSINATLSVLNGITPDSGNISVSLNPFQYIIELLQPIVGYDRIVNFITELFVYGLPMFEDSVKISLMEVLKNLFSCSINPIITRKIINEGVVLDLSTIDLLNIMNRCPIDNDNELQKIKGSFFYSDVDGFTIPDDLEKCSDLNAVIWFVKHRANDRTVWYGWKSQGDEHELLTSNNMPSVKDGIITMEYAEKATLLKDSRGYTDVIKLQVPHGNCLHVFLGNTKGVSDIPYPSSDSLRYKIEDFNNLSTSLDQVLTEIEIQMNDTSDIEEKTELSYQTDFIEKIQNSINGGIPINIVAPGLLTDGNSGKKYFTINNRKISMDEYTYTHSRNDIGNENIALSQARNNRINTYQYREPEQNYYYNKSLFEFNTDYIMSVKFFDTKVIASQIVNILTGCFDMSLNLSFEERLVRNEVEKMVTKVIENSDTVVSDCFFSFTNDDYNLLVDETEKEHMGLYTGSEKGYGSKLDYETIYNELNTVSNSATLSEQISTINHAFNTISKTIKVGANTKNDELSLNYEFLNNILKGLTLSLVYSIISPKIYLLIAINLKIMGREPNFDISSFIESFKTMIIDMIRSVTDKVMEQMKEWLVSLVKELVVRLGDKLLMEQADYYTRLLTSCIRSCAFIWGGSTQDWNMADVNYADIYALGSGDEGINTNC